MISVIVPVYNVEQYLQRCVDSILNQTYHGEMEIILIDQSTDGGVQICDDYALADSRIKLIRIKAEGLSHARNIGIDAAVGNYLLFVDSDDWLERDAVEYLYGILTEYSADIAIGSFFYAFSRKRRKKYLASKKNFLIVKTEVEEKMTNIPVMTWAKLYKKELFSDLKFPYNKLYEDVFTTHKLCFKAKKIVVSNKTVYNYFQRENSIMNRPFHKGRFDAIDAFQGKIRFFEENLPELRYIPLTQYCLALLTLVAELNSSSYEEKRERIKEVKIEAKQISKELANEKRLAVSKRLFFKIYLISPFIANMLFRIFKK